jgi:uncharacterized protein DUF6089
MKNRYLFFLLLIFLPTLLFSQSRRWQRTRYELIGATGVTNFMGELGGSDKEGSDYFRDFEVSSSRPLLHIGMRYKILEPLAVRAGISYGWLHGDDAKTENIYRKDRNIHFRSPIVEFATQLEYSIIKERVGHRYNLKRNSKFSLQSLKVNTYIFMGIAGFYFNPKAKDIEGDGEWHALQPMGTEGQGVIPTREKYKRFQMALPMGIGFKYNITRTLSIGLEYGMRFTFTDYIDDVSTTYVDPAIFGDDELAIRLADPSLRTLTESGYGANDQRGDPGNDDFYMFTFVSLNYKLNTGRNGLPKF